MEILEWRLRGKQSAAGYLFYPVEESAYSRVSVLAPLTPSADKL